MILFDFAGEPFAWTNMWSGRRGADIDCDPITFGGGCGYARVYDAGMIRLPKVSGGPPYDHRIWRWVQGLTEALRRTGDTFAIKNAQVAILPQKATYFSSVRAMDSHNVYNFANVLYQMHAPFDVITEDTICSKPTRFKIPLDRYRAIFVPHQRQFLTAERWTTLRQWLAAESGRMLCVGLHEGFDTHLNRAEPPEDMIAVTGVADYARVQRIPTRMSISLLPGFWGAAATRTVTVKLPTPVRGAKEETCPVGTFAERRGLAAAATTDGTPVIVRHMLGSASRVYSCGFPLGFRYLWRENEPDDPAALQAVFWPMLTESGVVPETRTPWSIRAHVSRRAKLLLIKERCGQLPTWLLRSRRLGNAVYAHVTTVKEADGATTIRGGLKPRSAIWAEKIADVEALDKPGFETGEAHIEGLPVRAVSFTLKGNGRFRIVLAIPPGSTMRVRCDGGMQAVVGRAELNRVRAGSPIHVTVKGEGRLSAERVQ